MFAAFLLLLVLIGSTPVILVVDGPVIHGLLAAWGACALIVVATTMRPNEARFFLTLIRPTAVVAAIPAVWMLIQVLPLGSIGLSHPVWQSASEALGRPIGGSISIDLGVTLVSLGRYLSTAAVALLAAAVTLDRSRAEWVLFALTGASGMIAAVLVTHDLGGFSFLSNPVARGTATDSAVLGAILSAAAGGRIVGQYAKRNRNNGTPLVNVALGFTGCLVSFLVCALAIWLSSAAYVLIAAASGFAALFTVVAIRRFSLGPWGISAIAALAVIIALTLTFAGRAREGDWTLAYTSHAQSSLMAATARMLDDTSWTGTGAGTFAALLPVYRNVNDPTTVNAAPSAAAALAIELGRPALWLLVAAAIAGAILLLTGAVRRGRDSSYPVAAAGCLAALAVLALGDTGAFGTTVAVIAAVAFGLGLAQSKSRTTQ